LRAKRGERDVVDTAETEAQAQRLAQEASGSLSTGIIEAHVTSASRKMCH